jgi:hypothetical protein
MAFVGHGGELRLCLLRCIKRREGRGVAKRTRKLKVFLAPFGFYESVVAAPSQAAALRAWGTSQNLFAEGVAHVVTDDEIILKAALAQPETPLKRAIGTKDPFSLKPGSPRIAGLDGHEQQHDAKVRRAQAAPSKPPPDRTRLTEAEEALARLRQEQAQEQRRLQEQRAALDMEEAALRQKRNALAAEETRSTRDWERRLSSAEGAVERERRNYSRAGGPD